jgi:hypothetical protein
VKLALRSARASSSRRCVRLRDVPGSTRRACALPHVVKKRGELHRGQGRGLRPLTSALSCAPCAGESGARDRDNVARVAAQAGPGLALDEADASLRAVCGAFSGAAPEAAMETSVLLRRSPPGLTDQISGRRDNQRGLWPSARGVRRVWG